MSKADKKQRHKAKREAKRLELRRRESISPLKRLADSIGEAECWMSDGFKENGQVQMFAYKRGAGLSGIACFLVDEGVVGLKDAWTRMGVDRTEFDGMLDASERRGISMSQVKVEDVRQMVAGGIRWANENGMRLPKDWIKTSSLIGGVGDWASADVSAFVREFAGHPKDLPQRLIGEPFETYIQRRDISFVFANDAPYMDQDTGGYAQLKEEDEDDLETIASELPEEELEALAGRFAPGAMILAGETANWLATGGKTASAELVEAWQSIMLASMLAKAAMPDGPDDKIADFSYQLLKEVSDRIEESRRVEHRHAVGQALEYLETDTTMMQKAVLKCDLANTRTSS